MQYNEEEKLIFEVGGKLGDLPSALRDSLVGGQGGGGGSNMCALVDGGTSYPIKHAQKGSENPLQCNENQMFCGPALVIA